MTVVDAARASLPASADIVISGGGPSGLFLALDLAHRGIESSVIEPRREIDFDRPRAKTTNARTMTHLRRLGLADSLRAAAPLSAEYAEDVVFCTGLDGHELARFRNAFQVQRDRYEPQPEAGQQVSQPVVEAVLRAAVERSERAHLILGAQVTSVLPHAGYSQVLVDGLPESTAIRARYIVGADGANSAVRRSLGIAYQGASAARSNLNVLFRSAKLADAISLGPALQYWVVSENVAGMVGRVDLQDTWWAIIQGISPERAAEEDAAELVRALVGVRSEAEVDIDVLATDPWTARMLLADSYGQHGAFLIGDAAHLNPPWGGHGFNTCIGDAANLAWKLDAALAGWGGPGLLDSYESERRPVAARTIEEAAANGSALAYDFARAGLDGDSVEAVALRAEATAALRVKQSEFDSLGLVLGYHYAESPLSAPDFEPIPPSHPIRYNATARAGALLPHWYLRDGRSLYDLLDDRGFTLLLDEDALGSLPREADPDRWPTAPGRVVRLGRDDGPRAGVTPAAAWGQPAVLVRPDQHVAWRGAEVEDARAALLRATGWQTQSVSAGSESGR
ncbi:FAD-dependent monooxygenase [Herbiconiux sp. P16]|uniref:FAD-dependent monooxygenase n=1 Tax=Herbiconiux wuyangfengii TaxID=3342794 RepID=UPI0035B85EC0